MKQILFFTFFLNTLLSCVNTTTPSQILETNGRFDLEKVTFNEDITKLFSKKLCDQDGINMDSIKPNIFSDTIFSYKIENYIAEAFQLKLPAKNLGFLYKSPQLDSVAKLDTAFCERLWTLTNNSKKPIAYYAEARFNTKKEKDLFIKNLKNKLGKTKYEFLISRDYNQCSYEWETTDKTIQIETSTGHEMSISTDNPNAVSSEYYRIDILIIENQSKKSIHDAHLLILPEKFSLKGKVDPSITYTEKDLKNLNLEKINTIKDEFLLNSYFDPYIKDEYGTYKISDND